ncbi:MAG: hypothetical protein WBQ94_19335 [Terracidiphilus sp.]
MHIVGGFYREICYIPPWNAVFGSGGRAAAAVSRLSPGSVLHTYAEDFECEAVPTGEETVDAALPFLSFAAGLMAAAEILKTTIPGYPFSPNRTTLYTHPEVLPRFVSPSVARRANCL